MDTVLEPASAHASRHTPSDASLLVAPHPSEHEFVTVARKTGHIVLWSHSDGAKIAEISVLEAHKGSCTVRVMGLFKVTHTFV